MLKVLWFIIKSIIKCSSLSDKGERALPVKEHFIYISSAWQGEGKISKNVTYIQTYRHFNIIYIYIIIKLKQYHIYVIYCLDSIVLCEEKSEKQREANKAWAWR